VLHSISLLPMRGIPQSGHNLDVPGGFGLEPTDAETQFVALEGGWLLEIAAEPRS
jgi:hypothetical protein